MGLTRIGLAIVAIAAAVALVFVIFRGIDERSAPPIVIEDAAAMRPIVVDVRGAVATPGVYALPAGARVQDAVNASGGLSEIADLSTVNLARRLRDGESLRIAALVADGGLPSREASDEGAAREQGGAEKININTASAEELDALPGIGPVTAARIVDFREQHGPYRSIDDLIHVQGISMRTVDGFRDLVTTGQ
ncbi:MAG: ComEA family DNA-binding protein [Thermomicrobiales bacterium]|nr:ComEA family DNA-binding protein [Thermomicrobiales bacterium]